VAERKSTLAIRGTKICKVIVVDSLEPVVQRKQRTCLVSLSSVGDEGICSEHGSGENRPPCHRHWLPEYKRKSNMDVILLTIVFPLSALGTGLYTLGWFAGKRYNEKHFIYDITKKR
jgi:hypothetical protein